MLVFFAGMLDKLHSKVRKRGYRCMRSDMGARCLPAGEIDLASFTTLCFGCFCKSVVELGLTRAIAVADRVAQRPG